MEPDQETPFPRPLSDAAVNNAPSGLIPARVPLEGRDVRLEPLNPSEHAAELLGASHSSEEARRIWDYLPDGPWASSDSIEAGLRNNAAIFERVTYAIRSNVTGRACGMASYLDIHPKDPWGNGIFLSASSTTPWESSASPLACRMISLSLRQPSISRLICAIPAEV
jgi:hypothetical protein